MCSKSGQELGFVKWYGPWRKYVFYPISATLFDAGLPARDRDLHGWADDQPQAAESRAAMSVNEVFRVTDPAIVARYREHRDKQVAWVEEVDARARALHPDAIIFGFVSHRGWSVSGLQARRKEGEWRRPVLEPVPAGWRWTPSRDCYRPVQGKAGDEARAWLQALPAAPKPAARWLVELVGLPTDVFIGHHVYWPGVWMASDDADELWVTYGVSFDAVDADGHRPEFVGDPFNLPGVERAKLSDYHLAREAAVEKEEATA